VLQVAKRELKMTSGNVMFILNSPKKKKRTNVTFQIVPKNTRKTTNDFPGTFQSIIFETTTKPKRSYYTAETNLIEPLNKRIKEILEGMKSTPRYIRLF
jgi:hypothetical protein